MPETSRPPARTRGLKLENALSALGFRVASSREDAWIETRACRRRDRHARRVLPRGRVD